MKYSCMKGFMIFIYNTFFTLLFYYHWTTHILLNFFVCTLMNMLLLYYLFLFHFSVFFKQLCYLWMLSSLFINLCKNLIYWKSLYCTITLGHVNQKSVFFLKYWGVGVFFGKGELIYPPSPLSYPPTQNCNLVIIFSTNNVHCFSWTED